MNKITLIFAALCVALCFGVNSAYSQGVTTGSMNGLVSDAKGEPVIGATVMLLHEPSGTQYGTATQGDGRYFLPNLRIGGPYKVTAKFVGYKDAIQQVASLGLGQNLSLNIKMTEDNATLEGVEIVSSGIINSDRTGASTTIGNERIVKLPTLNRSFNDFTRLTPQSNGQSFAGRSSAFNNITIDGAIFNNAFGLSSTVGGQTGSQPISIDALEEIQVNIAPYDVRQGSFTGAGINAVTKSGTNDFSGSFYNFLRDQSLVGSKVGNLDSPVNKFDVYQAGFRLGGPLIKDKLFFFVNAETESRSDPASTFSSKKGTETGSSVSNVLETDLLAIKNFLISKYNYNPGQYEGYSLPTQSIKGTAKIDWNINSKHKLAIKYNYFRSSSDILPSNSGATGGTRQPGVNTLPFSSANYEINNNLDAVIAELNSNLGSKFANQFTVGYSKFRDFRKSKSDNPFPFVDILDGKGNTLTSFGSEVFTAFNKLDTDVYQLSDNFNIFLGKHTVTVGTYNEYYEFANGFAPNYYGTYRFNSFADFQASANGTPGRVAQYNLQYSTKSDFPFAKIRAVQFGLYGQDEWQVKNNFKLTVGLRADLPMILSDLPKNAAVEAMTFRDGAKIDVSKVPETKVLWSPRVGVNWDVYGDGKLQVRGGSGIFTGRVPFVWLSNQASNNGVDFGVGAFNPTTNVAVPTNQLVFSDNVNAYRPSDPKASATYAIAVTSPTFKFPQVWRTNLGVDYKLGNGFVATFDGIFTQDLNAVYHQNINLPNAPTVAVGADNRPRWLTGNVPLSTPVRAYNQINPSIPTAGNGAILMDNTNKGYSYTLTGQIQKTFSKNWFASAAYTYTDAQSVNDGGSIANSIYRDRVVSGDPNANVTSYSNFLQRHRVIVNGSYRFEYAKYFATTLSLIYDVGPGNRFSYAYNGDMNGDGERNDLIYVPRDASEIVLKDILITKTVANGLDNNVLYSKEAQWNDLNAYIEQDTYLKNRRGQYAERNGAVAPWIHRLDFRLTQDIYGEVGGKNNNLQITFDVFNLANFINPSWGLVQTPVRAAALTFDSYDVQGRPVFTFPYLTNPSKTNGVPDGVKLKDTFQDSPGVGSRWQMQIGLRYIFGK